MYTAPFQYPPLSLVFAHLSTPPLGLKVEGFSLGRGHSGSHPHPDSFTARSVMLMLMVSASSPWDEHQVSLARVLSHSTLCSVIPCHTWICSMWHDLESLVLFVSRMRLFHRSFYTAFEWTDCCLYIRGYIFGNALLFEGIIFKRCL